MGGVSLLWNNITGPAMVALAGVYMNAGWLPATVLLALVGVMSGFGGGFLIEAMSRLPGNSEFEERIEMMYLARQVLAPGGLVGAVGARVRAERRARRRVGSP